MAPLECRYLDELYYTLCAIHKCVDNLVKSKFHPILMCFLDVYIICILSTQYLSFMEKKYIN